MPIVQSAIILSARRRLTAPGSLILPSLLASVPYPLLSHSALLSLWWKGLATLALLLAVTFVIAAHLFRRFRTAHQRAADADVIDLNQRLRDLTEHK